MRYYVAGEYGLPIKYFETLAECVEYLVQACVKNGNHNYLKEIKVICADTGAIIFDFDNE